MARIVAGALHAASAQHSVAGKPGRLEASGAAYKCQGAPNATSAAVMPDRPVRLDDRIGMRSTLIGCQLLIKTWHSYLNDTTFADAMIDRGRPRQP